MIQMRKHFNLKQMNNLKYIVLLIKSKVNKYFDNSEFIKCISIERVIILRYLEEIMFSLRDYIQFHIFRRQILDVQ